MRYHTVKFGVVGVIYEGFGNFDKVNLHKKDLKSIILFIVLRSILFNPKSKIKWQQVAEY